MNRAGHIIKKHLINPFYEKSTDFIGAELEFPIVSYGENPEFKKIGVALLRMMICNYGFTDTKSDEEGYNVRITNPLGDSISFECTYAQLEFSMEKSRNLMDLQTHFYELFSVVQNYYKKYDCVLTGMGINLKAQKKPAFVNDRLNLNMREFIDNYVSRKDTISFYANMCSTQTHIDIDANRLPEAMNLFNQLGFARALLFSNSPYTEKVQETNIVLSKDTVCVRDFGWEEGGVPNVGLCDKEFHDIGEMIEDLSEQKIYLKVKDGIQTNFKPVSLNEYFKELQNPEEDIYNFRSFRHVVVNGYHVLEVRSDCTQPLCSVFSSVAFNVGVYYNLDKIKNLVKIFFANNHITESNSKLRYQAVTFQKIVQDERMSQFLEALVELSREGLESRGHGEEILLEPLRLRARTLSSPAVSALKQLEKGADVMDIIMENSKVSFTEKKIE